MRFDDTNTLRKKGFQAFFKNEKFVRLFPKRFCDFFAHNSPGSC